MLKLFKTIAILEGISSILLFFIAMPLKYFLNNKQFMRPIGMAHGVLFCVFVIIALYFAVIEKWNLKKALIVFIASILPCGTFYIDKKYLKNA
jgi:integral membrane protein